MTIYRLPVDRRWAERNPGMDWFEESELEAVSDRQQRILRLRAGVDDGKQHSYRAVATNFGLKSPTRIRIEQNKAMHAIVRIRVAKGTRG